MDSKALDLNKYMKYADNKSPRCPLILLLDTSYSMNGEPINELNNGIKIFKQEIQKDATASLRVQVATITFGGTKPKLLQDEFIDIKQYVPSSLEASGSTPMSEAIELALDTLEQQKIIYKNAGIKYYRPWVFLITDGSPTDTDKWDKAAQRLKKAQKDKKLILFAIAVQGANINTLKEITTLNRPPVKLKDLQFKELFTWLSASMKQYSVSNLDDPGDQFGISNISWGFNV